MKYSWEAEFEMWHQTNRPLKFEYVREVGFVSENSMEGWGGEVSVVAPK